MPQRISTILEPGTSLILDRIQAINAFAQAGYEVHINFSPIVYYRGWLEDYQKLFEEIDQNILQVIKPSVLAECIFLTHNAWQHERNLTEGHDSLEKIIWQPSLQETKTSQYGSQAVRYKSILKNKLIQQWLNLHNKILAWNKVRYIF
jgi:spore photoproduct lyase